MQALRNLLSNPLYDPQLGSLITSYIPEEMHELVQIMRESLEEQELIVADVDIRQTDILNPTTQEVIDVGTKATVYYMNPAGLNDDMVVATVAYDITDSHPNLIYMFESEPGSVSLTLPRTDNLRYKYIHQTVPDILYAMGVPADSSISVEQEVVHIWGAPGIPSMRQRMYIIHINIFSPTRGPVEMMNSLINNWDQAVPIRRMSAQRKWSFNDQVLDMLELGIFDLDLRDHIQYTRDE